MVATRTSQRNLARLLEKLGDLPAASVLHAEAFASDLKTYGADHPKVAKRRATLTRLLHQFGGGMGRASHILYETEEELLGDTMRLRSRPDDSVLIEQALALNLKAAEPSNRLGWHKGPASPEHEQLPEASAAQAAALAITILWVDDTPRNNSYLVKILRHRGMMIDLAISTHEALERLRTKSYDIVISDMSRPEGMTAGLDLLTRVRATYPALTRFIFLPGSGQNESIARARSPPAQMQSSAQAPNSWPRSRRPKSCVKVRMAQRRRSCCKNLVRKASHRSASGHATSPYRSRRSARSRPG